MSTDRPMSRRACLNLVDAICQRAANDYRKSKGKDLDARDFFLHDRLFRTLNVDGSLILERLDKELARKRDAELKQAKPGRQQVESTAPAISTQDDGQFAFASVLL